MTFRPYLTLLLVLQLVYADVSYANEFGRLAGYEFHSDVSQHSYIDLDQVVIENNEPEASRIYSLGKNSIKSDGSLRSISGFSTSAGTKLKNEGFFELYRDYYGFPMYAHEFVVSALGGTGDFRNKPSSFRSESTRLGTKVLNIWMYVIHELEASINDCFDTSDTGEAKSIKHWDEGWAFYAGSLEGDDGSGYGVLLYDIAEKLCPHFGKCSNNGGSIINDEIMKLYNKGRDLIYERKCPSLIDLKIEIVKKMTAPLVQGLLYSASEYKKTQDDDYHATGLVYSRGFQPILSHCNTSSAEILWKNFAPNLENPVSDSLDVISSAVFKELKCMGITCDDVGKLDGLADCSSEGEYKSIPGANLPSIAEYLPEEFLGQSPEPEDV